jgi:predicted PurR-regulated permease PerM
MNDSDDAKKTRKIKKSSIPFIFLLCLFIVLSAVVVRPLAPALVWAAVLSFFTYPVYVFLNKKILKERCSYIASGINTALILFLLVFPMIAAGFAITREAARLYSFLVNWYPEKGFSLDQILSIPQFRGFFSAYPDFFSQPIWSELLSNASRFLASFMASISREMVGNVFKLAMNLVIITVASFFITHDGHIAVNFVKDILPLSDASKNAFFSRSKRLLYSIFYGVMMTAGIQGVLGAIGWRFVGLPNAFIFGSLMFFLAMVPFVGTPIVWGPGALYLFMRGDTKGGILLLIWGLAVVSSIDNFLRPIFISEGSKAHILMVFVGIIGGIVTWGFLGLFLGPLILSMTYFMLHLYRLFVLTNEDAELEESPERIVKNAD